MMKKRVLVVLAVFIAVILVSLRVMPRRYSDKITNYVGITSQWKTQLDQTKGNSYYDKHYELSLLSPIFHIDKIYRSMTGPRSKFNTNCFDKYDKPQLLWLTDYSVEVTDETGDKIISSDFMCHNNLNFPIEQYKSQFRIEDSDESVNSRFATLSEGQTRIELPEGFGIPFFSNDSVLIWAQALNHNISPVSLDVRHRIKIGYVAQNDVKKPLKPLFKRAVFVEVPVAEKGDPTMDANCNVQDCSPAAPSVKDVKEHADGKKYSGHWNIPEGKAIYRYNVTRWLHLTENTTLHFANVHLHPYAVSLTLRDVTDNKDLFTSYVENFKGKTGMKKIGHYSSTEGMPLYKDHEYELVCISNNTSHKEQDMMAVMILYIRDTKLEQNIAALIADQKNTPATAAK